MARLRFWPNVSEQLGKHYGKELGVDISKTRREAMTAIAERHPAFGSLLDRLAKLDPKTIPST